MNTLKEALEVSVAEPLNTNELKRAKKLKSKLLPC